jgi:NADH:ubiquinone oxidoreductase subunit 6 (subunit J)
VDAINWHSFFFLLFALVAGVFSIAVVATGNIVRMAFYLTIALGATAGLFFLAGASFVGAMQLLIYVGGTLVLLIFGVMLTAQGPFVSMKTRSGEWVFAIIAGGSLLALLLQAAFAVPDWQGNKTYAHATAITGSASRPDARVIIRAEKPDTMLGVHVAFEADPEARSVVEIDRGTDDKMTIWFTPGKATARQVEEAVNSSGAAVRAELPQGRTGDDYVTESDDATMSIRAPRGDTPPGEIGLSFLGLHDAAYLLPFEIISVHLLVVLIGAAYLARTKKRATQADRI